MAKAEISWQRRTPDGLKVQVYAHHVGDRWEFFQRGRRYDLWRRQPHPPLDDWFELLDGVQRRIARRLLRPEEADRVRSLIRQHYPETDLP